MMSKEKDIHLEKQNANRKWYWVFANTTIYSSYSTAVFTIFYSLFCWFSYGSIYPAFVNMFLLFPIFFVCIFLGSLWDWSNRKKIREINN